MATVDGDGARRATNRLSGFLASLIHRPPRSPPVQLPVPPPPAVRAATPPPALPPPTLAELGLSLSVLSPPHFSSPPTSGAFLAPHYLLLCHPQGLDVLPLRHPPLSHPFALVRRVPFKTVVVMEQRGVLVAVAGRRDGVRVYALDEVKKAIAWRIDQEARRERRDTVKKPIQPPPLLPRPPTPRKPRLVPVVPNERPPPYTSPLRPPRLHKSEWPESSDDEAINIVAAEASGSQALDERTSATLPSSLDLSLTRTATVIPSEPSPVPTLLTLRQALSGSQDTPSAAADDDDVDDDDGLTLVQVLSESRLPGLPPAGSLQPQQPILLSDHSPGPSRRRWSLLGNPPSPAHISRSQSFRSSTPSNDAPSTAAPSIASARSSRFIPRILSSAFVKKSQAPMPTTVEKKPPSCPPAAPQAPPPKLEYVKLPGTKGALMIKAVETPKKSFLAILCGENGEKVELFAGTYRTALGLSRTFILPDSPRSLELQLQGDDLVEVFLVFSQNVFGLEPATVRVREVRIGRAERRAARRRAREIRAGDIANNDSDAIPGEEDTNVSVNIVTVGSTVVATSDGTDTLIPNEHPGDTSDPAMTSTIAQSEELVALATTQMGPYTTFQQLSFAPNFPLASIADEYIIPPTYPSFLEYRTKHEPEQGSSTIDLTQVQFTPPGLPVPVPTAPSRWYYRDPRNVIHGPWKASLMQAWYKDGLLPLDLPVRREGSEDFLLLRDLRLQSVDPTHPFHSPPPATAVASAPTIIDVERPLLKPISLLAQPRHFGPPALFFSSRGGHSTAIVDARGRSVLKGRFIWSSDERNDDDDDDDASKPPLAGGRMGDIKRLEALDVDDRSVLVAMRQGGLEAVDLSDALLRPADESRTVLPQFAPPVFNINRRAPYVWKIGMPVASSPTTASVLSRAKAGSSHHHHHHHHHHHLSGKRSVNGTIKSPAVKSEFSLSDVELDSHEEVLFLGRKDDEIYLCERNTGSFRILCLCPSIA